MTKRPVLPLPCSCVCLQAVLCALSSTPTPLPAHLHCAGSGIVTSPFPDMGGMKSVQSGMVPAVYPRIMEASVYAGLPIRNISPPSYRHPLFLSCMHEKQSIQASIPSPAHPRIYFGRNASFLSKKHPGAHPHAERQGIERAGPTWPLLPCSRDHPLIVQLHKMRCKVTVAPSLDAAKAGCSRSASASRDQRHPSVRLRLV